MSIVFYHFFSGFKFRFHIKERGQPVRYVLILEDFWAKVDLKFPFRISST